MEELFHTIKAHNILAFVREIALIINFILVSHSF